MKNIAIASELGITSNGSRFRDVIDNSLRSKIYVDEMFPNSNRMADRIRDMLHNAVYEERDE